jgi:hypothetical protein
VRSNAALNFFDKATATYAKARAVEVHSEGGTLDQYRLEHNMLSSMPLCFNLFGALRGSPDLPRLLLEAFRIPVAQVVDVTCEWAPLDRKAHLEDRTAFDAFVRFSTPTGEPCFLAVETKYTETFSPTEYPNPIYAQRTDSSTWLRHGVSDVLRPPATNQLWRNLLLAESLAATSEFHDGWTAVLSLDGDRHIPAAPPS